MSKTKTKTENGVHTIHPEAEMELRAQDTSPSRTSIPDVESIPALVVSLYDQIQSEQRRSVQLAHEIGRLLMYARRELKGDYKDWLANNITGTIGERQTRKYMRLAGFTKDGKTKKSHWQIIADGVKHNKFGVLDSQFSYTIDGCLRYLSTVLGKKGGKKATGKEPKKIKVKRDDVLKVLKENKVSEDVFNHILAELGYMLYEPVAKK